MAKVGKKITIAGWTSLDAKPTDSSSDRDIDNNKLVEAKNVTINRRGDVRSRNGVLRVGDVLSSPTKGLHYSYELDKIYMVEGTNTRYLNGSTWDTIDTAQTTGLPTTMATIEGKTYFANGTDELAYTTGTNWAEIAEAGTGKIGKFVFVLGTHLIMAGRTATPRTVYSSKIISSAAPTAAFDTSHAESDSNDLNDGKSGAITGGAMLRSDQLILFTENAAFQISIAVDSSGNSNLSTTRLSATGCVAHKSIVQVDNGLIYLSRDGVHFLGQIEGFDTSLLSRKISTDIDSIIESIKPDNLSLSEAGFYKDRYKLSIPTGDSTVNNTEVVFLNTPENRGWTRSTGKNVSGGYERIIDSSNNSEKFYIGGQDGVFQDEKNFDDNSFGYESLMITKDFTDEDPSLDCRWAYVSFDVNVSAATQLEFSYALDGAKDFASNSRTVSVDDEELTETQTGQFGQDQFADTLFGGSFGGGVLKYRIPRTLHLENSRARSVQFRFKTDATDQPFEVLNLTVGYNVAKKRSRSTYEWL